jgi:hypothetical protein
LPKIKVGVVGTCGSGKSALVSGLEKHGYTGKHIAQEHSFAPKMWQRLTNPDILVYLYVSYEITLARKTFRWTAKEYQEQIRRLQHAIDHADIMVNTDLLTPEDVLGAVLEKLVGL